MNHSYSYMGQVLVVMEGGVTHAHGAQPGICEVLPVGDGLHDCVRQQYVHDIIVPGYDVTRYLWIEMNQIEGDSEKERAGGNSTF